MIELPYDPAIPLLSIYLEETLTWKDACTPVIIAPLFTIAKTREQPKCPLTHEWIKTWHIYTTNTHIHPYNGMLLLLLSHFSRVQLHVIP